MVPSQTDVQSDEDVEKVLSAIVKDDIPKSKRNEMIKALSAYSNEKGLTPEHLDVFVKLLHMQRLAIFVQSAILKALIPRTTVKSKTAVYAISLLCTNDFSLKVQTLIVRWILVIYGYLEETEPIAKLYGILFYFVTFKDLSPYICHLLHHVTRSANVTSARITRLLELQKSTGPQPYLLALLSTFKAYAPHLVAMGTTTKKALFRKTDARWSNVILKVQCGQQPSFLKELGLAPLARNATRKDVIPAMGHQVESAKKFGIISSGSRSVPFSQLRSFRQLIEEIDRIEPPAQVGVVLRDNWLRHLFSMNFDPVLPIRLTYWLNQLMYSEFLEEEDENKEFPHRRQLLKSLAVFADFLQEGVPLCDFVIGRFCENWKPKFYSEGILKMISRFHFYQFDVQRGMILEPLKKLFSRGNVYLKSQILNTLVDYIGNIIEVEISRYQKVERLQRSGSSETICVFQEEVQPRGTYRSLRHFVRYVERLCLCACVQNGAHPLLEDASLRLFEVLATAPGTHDLPFYLLPRRQMFYLWLFSPNLNTVARVCDLLTSFREAHESVKQLKSQPSFKENLLHDDLAVCSEVTQQSSTMNGYIKDTANTLWLGQAFDSEKKDPAYWSVYSLLDSEKIRDIYAGNQLKSTFNLLNHPASVPYRVLYYEELQQIDSKSSKRRQALSQALASRHYLPAFKRFVDRFIHRTVSSSLSQSHDN